MPCPVPLGEAMRRRKFIALLGGAATAWPLAAGAQQVLPAVGFLRQTRADQSGHLVAAVRQGLRESGYSNDKVAIESRWGDGHEERLPKLAAELVALQVSAIVGAGTPALRAAEAVTASIPIVFVVGTDPVAAGLVSSLNRPVGNITGVSFYDIPIIGKRFVLLRELVPNAEIIAVLQDPNSPGFEAETREIEATAHAIGQKIIVVKARSEHEIDAAFSIVAKSGAGALLAGGGPLFAGRRNQLIGLAALHAIPASYFDRGFVDAGGLLSYGASQTDAYRRAGIYVARILKGEKPSDLPVELPTKYELVVNLKTAKTLGLIVPPSLLARADEVIE
jgi:ABC-type uncharacterized transport system substrate-binding protein